MPLWRAFKKNVYFTCMRCGTREPLSRMKWQYGLLLCSTFDCIDKAVTGARDVAVAKTVAINRHELEPEPKLVTPTPAKDDLDVLFEG